MIKDERKLKDENKMNQMKIAIVVSEFNSDMTLEMLEEAKSKAQELDIEIIKIIKVPGAYDIPLAVKKLLKISEIEGVATLGCIIKGSTDHDHVIASSTAERLSELSLEFEKPVTLGIIGPNVTKEQAYERVSHYACHSVESLLKIKNELKNLKE